ANPERKAELNDESQPEIGNRKDKDRERGDRAVPPGGPTGSSDRAQSRAANEGDEDADAGQQERAGKGVGDGVARRSMLEDGVAKVSSGDARHVARQLHG